MTAHGSGGRRKKSPAFVGVRASSKALGRGQESRREREGPSRLIESRMVREATDGLTSGSEE